MNKFELKGQVHSIKPTQTFDSGFSKREIVLLLTGEDVNPEYPDFVQFEFIKDKCDKLDGYTVGQEVIISFNIGGRLWDSPQKGELCFVALKAWNIKALSQPIQGGGAPAAGSQVPDAAAFDDNLDEDSDSIPF